MKTALDARAIIRAGAILVLAALAFTLTATFTNASASDNAVGSATHATVLAAGDDAGASEPAEAPSDDGATTAPDERTTDQLAQNIVNGIAFGLLLALASVGLSLIYGTTGLSNFGHGEQVSFGALLTYFFATKDQLSLPLIPDQTVADVLTKLPGHSEKMAYFGFNLWIAAILAIAISGFTGWLQDKYLWSKLRKRRIGVTQQMIVSIGLSLALVNLLQWWFGGRRVRLSIAIDERFDLGFAQIGKQTLVSMGIAAACLIGVSVFLLYTRLGRATRAVSDNPSLAAASGIKVDGIIRLVWVLATALAAVGGILLALYEQGTAFDAGSRLLLLMFAAVTLGGLGQPFGALVGSLVIGIVAEVSTVWLPPDLKFATALAILILVLLFRPQGILGRAERVG